MFKWRTEVWVWRAAPAALPSSAGEELKHNFEQCKPNRIFCPSLPAGSKQQTTSPGRLLSKKAFLSKAGRGRSHVIGHKSNSSQLGRYRGETGRFRARTSYTWAK
jgi:hypothetical protein